MDKLKIELTFEQHDSLLAILSAVTSAYAADAAVLLTVTGAHEQLAHELAQERLADVAAANELIALLMQCG